MKKILIIDDDPDIVEAMRMVLEAQDFEVHSAINGTEGLSSLSNHVFDGFLAGHVNREEKGFCAGFFDLARYTGAAFLIDIGNHYPGTLGGKAVCDSSPNAASGTGDNDVPACKPSAILCHAILLYLLRKKCA